MISTAAVSFLRNNIDVYGIYHGYSHLVEYGPDHSMAEGRDYLRITHNVLRADAQQPRDHDRHRPDQSRQGHLASRPI